MENLQNLELKLISGAYNKKADGVYIGDILSYALAKIKEGNIWVTSQINVNVVAIAFQKKAACVILADGLMLDDEAYKKAKEHNVNVFSSSKSAYEIAVDLCRIYGGKNE